MQATGQGALGGDTRRRTAGLGIALALLGVLAAPARAAERVVVLTLHGTVQPGSERYLERGLGEADRRGAALTVLELDTPGGLLPSLRQMTRAITAARRPVAVFVAPAGAQAASAGFFLLMAADVAAMAPGTNAGAAHPVALQGELPKTMVEKATNDAAALIRSLASQRHRSVEWAERAVRRSLSYSADEARAKGLIDVVAADRGDLLRRLDGRTVRRFDGRQETLHLRAPEIVALPPNVVDRLLMTIAHPTLAYLLFLVGIIGLAFEMTHPGFIAPGVVGALSLLLALFAFSLLPVNYVGLLLILTALGLFVAEVWVTSYGLLTVCGLVAFVLGSLMLVNAPFHAWRIGLPTVLPAAALLASLILFLGSRVARTRRMKPTTGAEGMQGEIGEVVAALEPEGKVFVHGEYWDAIASTPLPRGARARVVKVIGERLHVEDARSAPPPGETGGRHVQ
jgi:membrane-bound serine protease (ClpP class)